jgi:hypothetical protein
VLLFYASVSHVSPRIMPHPWRPIPTEPFTVLTRASSGRGDSNALPAGRCGGVPCCPLSFRVGIGLCQQDARDSHLHRDKELSLALFGIFWFVEVLCLNHLSRPALC